MNRCAPQIAPRTHESSLWRCIAHRTTVLRTRGRAYHGVFIMSVSEYFGRLEDERCCGDCQKRRRRRYTRRYISRTDLSACRLADVSQRRPAHIHVATLRVRV
eukprot:654352-Prorocentrum_minimum.AAC.1